MNLVKKSNKGITMYYCYYESCNYTLNDTRGVFQSSGFPGKYPDGQLCSWRIMVPDNRILHVYFTNFSLYESAKKDNLTFLTFVDGSFHLNDTFHGHHNQPFTITETNDVLFEFLTNEEGHSTGFRAEYTVFKSPVPPETTPSPQSTTRTNGQTTTIIPITSETKNKTSNSTNDNFKKSRVSECDGADTTILIVIPLICLIVVIAIVIIVLYRWRSKKTKCEKCASTRYPKDVALNPTYDDAGRIQLHQRASTATMNTALGTDDINGQMYETLSRDKQPEYQAPNYSRQNGANDPSMNSELPEYHELEPMGNNVPDVVYDVLEGPDSNGGPSGDQMYQALDEQTTHNPLYQSNSPATMVTTRNPMYVHSVA
ncbi:uncharacterized protein LOC116301291 isoform X2 [Actinia tenebrosa]|uniref:Uncharacterized protein LOC116301291 isoform X2 n=1 Tax=Actinia tenebrosa TaxID=6105 RepID=A0A6P8IHJ4_ACTTE|nr:uncharacterized protein LOC116301291 isoform X2 [Actinia tenebrosa]